MPRFFHAFRKRLLRGNRLTRYLVYALGEIVLVVIGILIALEVNNRNSEAKIRRSETQYLNEIAKSLRSDLKDVHFNIGFNEDRLRSSRIVLDFLNSEVAYSDTLDRHFGSLLYTTRSVVNYSAFDALTSQGIEIIANDSLRRLITNLYSFHYHNVIDFEKQDDHALQYHVVMPGVLEHVQVRPVPGGETAGLQLGRPIDLSTIRQGNALQNALTMNIDLRIYMLSNYRQLEQRILECQQAIENELEKRSGS